MLEGLYAAGSGMEAQQQQLDAISSDIANADTPGYQSRIVGFQDLLYTTDGQPAGSATVGSGAAASTIGYSQTQGSLQVTNNPLDVALQGPGYLEVKQADGSIGLTRNGVLQLNANDQLQTAQGLLIQPPITVPKGTAPESVSIAGDGTVTVGQTKIGQIGIVSVPAPNGLVPSGSGVFSASAASGTISAATGTTIRQGALEQSNVDLNSEMSKMMQAQQSYDMASKAIQFESQMGQIAATLH